MLWAFLPIAALMTITPGPATAMIVRSALRGGVRVALATILGNSAGVLTWAVLSALGTSTASVAKGTAFRSGLVTSVANPKLAVFFVALFPQFVTDGAPVLPPALAMAGLIVMLDLAWYSTLAVLVDRSRRALTGSRIMQRLEALMGAVLVGLGVRVALEQR